MGRKLLSVFPFNNGLSVSSRAQQEGGRKAELINARGSISGLRSEGGRGWGLHSRPPQTTNGRRGRRGCFYLQFASLLLLLLLSSSRAGHHHPMITRFSSLRKHCSAVLPWAISRFLPHPSFITALPSPSTHGDDRAFLLLFIFFCCKRGKRYNGESQGEGGGRAEAPLRFPCERTVPPPPPPVYNMYFPCPSLHFLFPPPSFSLSLPRSPSAPPLILKSPPSLLCSKTGPSPYEYYLGDTERVSFSPHIS